MNIVNVGYDSTNYYVIEQHSIRLLVDAGWPGTLSKFSAVLKRKGIELAELSYLCVTHYHPDHAGLVEDLKEQGVKHIVVEPQVPAIPLLKGLTKSDSSYKDIQFQSSVRISIEKSRAWLASIGLPGEIVHTPGHSDDSISIVLDTGVAFTGDMTPSIWAGEEGAALVEQSWSKLRELNVRTIYPGHGQVRPIP
jgi:endoribonuclease LACTB2